MTKARGIVAAAALVVTLLGGAGATWAQTDYMGRRPVTVTRDPADPADPADPGTKVLGRTVTRAAPIPITGADVAGLALVGVGAVGTGAYLLRRGRRAPR